MKVAATSAEESLPEVETLLREGTFQQRMEAARKKRELVLATRAAETGEQAELTLVHRPWGRQDWDQASAPAPEPRSLADRILPAANIAVAAMVAPVPAAVTPAPVPALQPAPARGKGLAVLRTTIGFALGLGLGVALTLAIPFVSNRDPALPTADQSTVITRAPVTGSAVPLVVESELEPDPAERGFAPINVPVPDVAPRLSAPGPTTALQSDVVPALDVSGPRPIPQGFGDWLPRSPVAEPPAARDIALALSPVDQGPAVRSVSPLADLSALLDQPATALAPPLAPGAATGADFPAVNIHILLSKGDSAAEATAIVAKLQAAGFSVLDTAETRVAVSATNVRYYHAADADAAQAIAAQLGATARDFTGFSPVPPAGRIEVWLKGTATGDAPLSAAVKVKAKVKKAKTPAASAADAAEAEALELQAQRDRLLLLLQQSINP